MISARLLLAIPLALAVPAATTLASESAPPPISDWAATCEDWADWDKPGPPFRIHGDTYYVGTCGIAVILIDTGNRLVLIDSGTEAGADVVLANIRALGIDTSRPIEILQSHEHFDHVGGIAKLAQALSATVVVNQEVVEVYRTGQADPRDPQAGMHEPMRPVANVRPLMPGAAIDYDGFTIQSIATPGHTPGALSWRWQSCDVAGACKTIVYADSLSAISADSYRFTDHTGYVAQFRSGLNRLSATTCDILITPHPSGSNMRERALDGGLESGPSCAEYAAAATTRLEIRLEQERAAPR